jgi:uncharacterized membrane protein
MSGESGLFVLSFAAALGCGVVAGTFFAFSTFVMRALSRLPPTEGIDAMQSINVVVLNPRFLGAFVGMAAACAAVIVWALMRLGRPGSAYLVAGGAVYLAGTFLVTILFNVPLNDSLAAISPTDADAPQRWADYVRRWTIWNHVRTAAGVAALGLLVLGMCR